jgi:hypothetical protein
MQDQILAYIDSIPASIMEHLPVDPVTQRPWNNLDTLMVAVENRAAVMITAHPSVFNTKAVTFIRNTNQVPSQAPVGRSNKKAKINSTKPYSSTNNKPATSSFTTATFKSPCRWCVRLGVPGDNMHSGQACKNNPANKGTVPADNPGGAGSHASPPLSAQLFRQEPQDADMGCSAMTGWRTCSLQLAPSRAALASL